MQKMRTAWIRLLLVAGWINASRQTGVGSGNDFECIDIEQAPISSDVTQEVELYHEKTVASQRAKYRKSEVQEITTAIDDFSSVLMVFGFSAVFFSGLITILVFSKIISHSSQNTFLAIAIVQALNMAIQSRRTKA